MRKKQCNVGAHDCDQKGITLVALVITIVVLAILVGVSISTILNSGVIKNADTATTGYNKEQATEIMNLKITNIQIKTYAETQIMPNLQMLADALCKDGDMEYVQLKNEDLADLDKIEVGEAESILVKMWKYPYEFEIDSSLRLASIDGVKIADDTITVSKQQFDELTTTVSTMQQQLNSLIDTLGSMETVSNEITATAKSTNDICSLTLSKGTYILLGNVHDEDTGNHLSVLFNNADYSTNVTTHSSAEYNTVAKRLDVTGFVEVEDNDKTVILKAYSLNAHKIKGSMIAIKLK